MGDQEDFNKWWEEHGQYVRSGGGGYEACFAYAAWKFARAQALEDAAKAIEGYAKDLGWSQSLKIAGKYAEIVRALAEQAGKGDA